MNKKATDYWFLLPEWTQIIKNPDQSFTASFPKLSNPGDREYFTSSTPEGALKKAWQSIEDLMKAGISLDAGKML